MVSFLESSRVGYRVTVGLHPVTGHNEILTGIMMDVMLSLQYICNTVCHRLLPVWGSPRQQVTRQTWFPNEHHAGGHLPCSHSVGQQEERQTLMTISLVHQNYLPQVLLSVLMSSSTMPSDWRWRVVHVLHTLRCHNVSCNSRNSKVPALVAVQFPHGPKVSRTEHQLLS